MKCKKLEKKIKKQGNNILRWVIPTQQCSSVAAAKHFGQSRKKYLSSKNLSFCHFLWSTSGLTESWRTGPFLRPRISPKNWHTKIQPLVSFDVPKVLRLTENIRLLLTRWHVPSNCNGSCHDTFLGKSV